MLFHPFEPAPRGIPQPLAHTDKNGNFQLTTLNSGDGALPGRYNITIEFRDLRQDGDEMIRDGRNLLPAKYASSKTSGFEYTVNEGVNEVPPLELHSR